MGAARTNPPKGGFCFPSPLLDPDGLDPALLKSRPAGQGAGPLQPLSGPGHEGWGKMSLKPYSVPSHMRCRGVNKPHTLASTYATATPTH